MDSVERQLAAFEIDYTAECATARGAVALSARFSRIRQTHDIDGLQRPIRLESHVKRFLADVCQSVGASAGPDILEKHEVRASFRQPPPFGGDGVLVGAVRRRKLERAAVDSTNHDGTPNGRLFNGTGGGVRRIDGRS